MMYLCTVCCQEKRCTCIRSHRCSSADRFHVSSLALSSRRTCLGSPFSRFYCYSFCGPKLPFMITEGNISRPRATPLSYMEAAMDFTQLLPISTKLPLLLQMATLTFGDFTKLPLLLQAVEGVGPGVESIELIKDPQNPSKNRGFAFVLYYNNACADYSRQKMSSSSFNLCGNTPTVTWADPKNSPDHSASSQD